MSDRKRRQRKPTLFLFDSNMWVTVGRWFVYIVRCSSELRANFVRIYDGNEICILNYLREIVVGNNSHAYNEFPRA